MHRLVAVFAFALSFALLSGSVFARAPGAGPGEAAPAGGEPKAQKPKVEDDDDLLKEIEEEFEKTEPTPGWKAPAEEVRTFPYIEHHGYFRFRPDLLWRLHLGTHTRVDGQTVGTSGVRPPLSENVINNEDPLFGAGTVGSQDKNTLAGANIRFRYTPTLHISPELRVVLQLDILDNLVLGSTPDFDPSRPDVPLVAFSGSMSSPSSGRNGFRDAVRVTQAYGEWLTPFGLIRVGRQESQWGLGILANGGQGYDSDYGDFVDRAMLVTRIPKVDLYVVAAWDYVASGKSTDSGAEFFGQPTDLSEQDDVVEYVGAIFQQALSEKEKAERHHKLHVLREPVFEWGVYYVYRSQKLDLSVDKFPAFNTGYDGIEFVNRDAFAHIPDLWLKLEWAPAAGQLLSVEMEAVMIVGEIGNVLDDPTRDGQRDIFQLGGALETSWTTLQNRLKIGLMTGFGSGDDAEGFGVLDRKNFEIGGKPNRRITNFKFDRNYYVDEILFREVIGAVTNAVYVKPWVQWDFFEKTELDLGARLDIEWARALEPAATPGNDPNLGLELDLTLFYEEVGVFRADFTSAFFFPGAAFDLVKGFQGSQESKEASLAIRLHGRLIWFF